MVEQKISSFKEVGTGKFKGFDRKEKPVEREPVPPDAFSNAKKHTLRLYVSPNQDIKNLLSRIDNTTTKLFLDFGGHRRSGIVLMLFQFGLNSVIVTGAKDCVFTKVELPVTLKKLSLEGYIWHLEFPDGFPNLKQFAIGTMANYKELEPIIRNSNLLDTFGVRETYSKIKEIIEILPSSVKILAIRYSENVQIPSSVVDVIFYGDVTDKWNNGVIKSGVETVFFDKIHPSMLKKINLEQVKWIGIKNFLRTDGTNMLPKDFVKGKFPEYVVAMIRKMKNLEHVVVYHCEILIKKRTVDVFKWPAI
jgi:hypothetical protein